MPSPAAPERLVGLDYGRVRIGVAVSDGPIAVPYGFIPRQDDVQAAAAVAAVAASHRAIGIVLGMPRNTDGSYGENARWVQRFRAALARATTLPITLVDERHSSAEAEAELRRAGRWPCPPGQLDALAATIILRRHLG